MRASPPDQAAPWSAARPGRQSADGATAGIEPIRFSGTHETYLELRDVLKPEHRMRRTAEFTSTVRQGVRVGRPLVVVHVTQPTAIAGSDEPAPVRVGFVVARSVGGAVVRNAVRRRLRHLMADRLADVEPGTEVVVRARPEAAHCPSSVLARDLDDALAAARSRLGGRR